MLNIFELYRRSVGGAYSMQPPVVYPIVMSGLTSSHGAYADANGNYQLLDDSMTGTSRIWKHESAEFYVRYVYSTWALTPSATSTSYSLYIQSSSSYQAPYNEETGESYIWYYQGSQASSVQFYRETYGNTNFLLKETDDTLTIYNGLYIRQTVRGLDYNTPCVDGQLWVRKPSFKFSGTAVCALWAETGNWVLGTIDGETKTARVTVPANGSWPWHIIDQFGSTLAIQRTQATAYSIPQGVEVTEGNYGTSFVGQYPYRYISGSLFPVEGDAFYEFDKTGRSFVCYKDYTGKLKWGLRASGSSSNSFIGDAEWNWPDTATFSMQYGGGSEKVNSILTGETNLRVNKGDLEISSFTGYGVYRRVETLSINGKTVIFDYKSPGFVADVINGNEITSSVKLWIRAAEYDAFIEDPTTPVGAFIMLNPDLNKVGLTSTAVLEDSPYASGYYCYGTVQAGQGENYLKVTETKGFYKAPELFWPWELDDEYYGSKILSIIRTTLDRDPAPPPVAMAVKCNNLRCLGYYTNRQLQSTETPSNGDIWMEGGLSTSTSMTSIHYNGSKTRWECYIGTNMGHTYMYSDNTTELWPDDKDLKWYSGDRGIVSAGTLLTDVVITGSNEPLVSDRVIISRLWKSAYGSLGYAEMWPGLNAPLNTEVPPSIDSCFTYYYPDDEYRRKYTVAVATDENNLFYWKLYNAAGGEYQSMVQLATTIIGANDLETLGWPWDRFDWAAYEIGGQGLGGTGITPPSFAVKGTDITQNYGSFTGNCTASNAGIPEANSNYNIKSSDIDAERPEIYTKSVVDNWQLSLCYDVGYTNSAYWLLSYYDETDPYSFQDKYRPYVSGGFPLNALKWPWEVTWTVSRYNEQYNPPPVFNKGDATVRGTQWGDLITLEKQSGEKEEIPFSYGKTLPQKLTGVYQYVVNLFNSSGEALSEKTTVVADFNGTFRLTPSLLMYEWYEGYDAVYISDKEDQVTRVVDPDDGSYSTYLGADGGRGVILGKINASGTFDWTFTGIMNIDTPPGSAGTPYSAVYTATGETPIGLEWEANAMGTEPLVLEIPDAVDAASTVPGLTPRAVHTWKNDTTGTEISWIASSKCWRTVLDGTTYDSVSFDKEDPQMFPWELTDAQWRTAPFTLGIKGSRVKVIGTTVMSGNGLFNSDGLYFSEGFGGKYADQSAFGYNPSTYYYSRAQETSDGKIKPHRAFDFELENSGGPQWKLYASGSVGAKHLTRLVKQDVADWKANVGFNNLPTPYDFEAFYTHRREAAIGSILPSIGHVIPNGQIDYSTVKYFGARFTVTLSFGEDEPFDVALTYTNTDVLLVTSPHKDCVWEGSGYKCYWDSANRYWVFEAATAINEAAGKAAAGTVTTIASDSDTPDMFPWEYRLYEFSTWNNVQTGSELIIHGFTFNGSRIVITGGADDSSYTESPNGSYASYYVKPDNYPSGTYYRWFNEYGKTIGRFNNSTRWVITGFGDQIYAKDNGKLPWIDEDFTTNTSYSLKPKNYLINGRPIENTTGFASKFRILGSSSASLNGTYVLVGYILNEDGSFSELKYEPANNNNACSLTYSDNTWILSEAGLEQYSATASEFHYPQDPALTWEAVNGDPEKIPLIVAVDNETKVPAPDNWVLTATNAGTTTADGTYTSDQPYGSYGICRTWTNENGIKLECYISGKWEISNYYEYNGLQNPNGTYPDPFDTETGESVTWEISRGAEPAPSVTAEVVLDAITVSGSNTAGINGEYNLIDDTAEGDDRIWTNGTYYIARGTGYTVWMVRNVAGRPSNPGSGGVYFYGSDTTKSNPYNDDGTSYGWYAMSGSGTLSVIKS